MEPPILSNSENCSDINKTPSNSQDNSNKPTLEGIESNLFDEICQKT
jgi:hypothetical protein